MKERAPRDSQRVTIAVDVPLKRDFAPEIAWTFRTAFGTLGHAWREVGADDAAACDVVYSERRPPGAAGLWIPADRTLWSRAPELQWNGLRSDPSSEFPQPEFAVVTPGGREILPGRDAVFALFWLVAGLSERHVPKNRHGHLDFSGAPGLQGDVCRQAAASRIIGALGKALRRHGCAIANHRWPDGKRAAFCCGHDVDYPEVVRWLEPVRVVRRQGIHGLGNAIAVATGRKDHWNVLKWMDLEERYGLRSAFYFVPRQGSLRQYACSTPDPFYNIHDGKFRAMFREIADRGCEIGTHASYWAFRDVDEFRSEKESLEEAAGVAVVGNRHHYWHLDPRCPEATLSMHQSLGYEYDSSLTNERYVGWRRSLCTPFFPFHRGERREIRTLQIPTGWMDDQLFRYATVNPGDPQRRLAELVDVVAEQEGCLMVDVHDYVFDEDLFPGWRRRYEEVLERVSRRGDFWLATPKEISRHWTARYRNTLDASSGLMAGV